ncbi:GH116 family glycosyl-hydrolase [Coraliomargarita algicola]|uniref:GH116 family glycosyl-hydrolase n=1 Tax=Coraliomargarita algicola TaxID=3092156 RepID=A0ABZ0RLC4_9BACT|nr:GH116 family glycosyl-hydrolase [Coraliomargarita sp. J2-16]WPJ97016.1 GH116 family glycosyl-hydrolase [Coraliomargarita sp. J2-16]
MVKDKPIATNKDSVLRADVSRRRFLKAGALSAAGLSFSGFPVMAGPFSKSDLSKHLIPFDKKLSAQWLASLTQRGVAEVFKGGELKYVGMPIGGMGCGQLYLGGDGKLWLWDIFKSNYYRVPNPGNKILAFPMGGHYAEPVAQGDPYSVQNGVELTQGFLIRTQAGTKTLDRQGFPDVQFRGEYPVGKVSYADADCPVTVQLEAFSPFIPLNAKDSAIPATVMRYTVTNPSDQSVEVDLGGWLQNTVCPYLPKDAQGERRNTYVQSQNRASILSSIEGAGLEAKHGYGSMSLSLLQNPQEAGLSVKAVTSLDGSVEPAAFVDQASGMQAGASASKALNDPLAGGLFAHFELAPGESRTVDFAITWFFPNYAEMDAEPLKGSRQDSRHIFRGRKRLYSNYFDSAEAVAEYLASDNKRILESTLAWNQTWYDSTLPYWLLDRSFIGLDCIATQTFHYFENGRPYGWEGVECCPGTCTHVWYYSQALGRIFPEVERAFREKVDFDNEIGMDADSGMIKDRGEYHQKGGKEALDGQAGSIMRVYREHQMSADDAFLRRMWPNVKQATEFLISKDADDNGLWEGAQPHTLDAAWYGPMGWLSSLYLGALAAAEAMALEVGDADFAKRCRTLLDRGYKNIVAEVFDGEYFIHKPTGKKALNSNKGCHIDQVIGQAWAHQVGLGRIIPKQETVSALNSIWKYNFAPDAGQYALDHREIEAAFRWYAMPGEAGLLMTTWPKGGAKEAIPGNKLRSKENPDRFTSVGGYFNECMNGFEYQVAAHMLYEGEPDSELVEKGLAIIKAVHERYGAAKRNPYNEIECGDHYARSMASYGVFLAACGFEYHGPQGYLAFAPRIQPKDFKAPFTTAEGWGTFSQKLVQDQQLEILELRHGQLRLNTLAFAPIAGSIASGAKVELDGKSIAAEFQQEAERYMLNFENGLSLKAGQKLKIQFV